MPPLYLTIFHLYIITMNKLKLLSKRVEVIMETIHKLERFEYF